jgi:protein SCO1/2
MRTTLSMRMWLLAVALALPGSAWAGPEHPARGIVLEVDPAHRFIVISCDAVPGYMDPMEMRFELRDASHDSSRETATLSALKPGKTIRFTIVEAGHKLYADSIQTAAASNFEPEPMEAGGLSVIDAAMHPGAPPKLEIGQPAPDFTLTDQAGKAIRLSQFAGKVVALTFGYSHCPNPDYCVRLSTNLSQIEKRFHAQGGRDLVLLTIMIDPERDQGAALSEYAAVWKADPAEWHFLTGPLLEIHQLAGNFGMNFWTNEGLITHTLHTVILDRHGRLAANLSGNHFTPKQLGDLVQTVLDRKD